MIRDTKIHIYSVLKSKIIQSIINGQYPAGSVLPSEAKLADIFDVSRNSVREALASLEQEGLVIRRQGIGTIVSQHPFLLQNKLDRYKPIPDLVRGLGYTSKMEFSNTIEITGPSYGHETLKKENAKELFLNKRLYSADGIPAIYIKEYIDKGLVKKKINWDQFDGNMIEFFYEEQEITIHHVYAKVTAGYGSAEVAKIFKVDEKFPFLRINHIAVDNIGRMVSCTETYDHSDLFSYEFVRVRDH